MIGSRLKCADVGQGSRGMESTTEWDALLAVRRPFNPLSDTWRA